MPDLEALKSLKADQQLFRTLLQPLYVWSEVKPKIHIKQYSFARLLSLLCSPQIEIKGVLHSEHNEYYT